MDFVRYFERLKRMDTLIRLKATGCPVRFANRLEMSQASLYRHLNALKNLGAPIQYCKQSESYIYEEPYNLRF